MCIRDSINGLINNNEIGYSEIQKGEIRLPISRSMYLDRILQDINSNVNKSDEFKKIVRQVSKREIEDCLLYTSKTRQRLQKR